MTDPSYPSDSFDSFGDISLHELFRCEAESQVQVLTDGLLALDRDAGQLTTIEPLMRAAHSLKGAARIINLSPIERLAHVMEDCFVAAQKQQLQLGQEHIDRLLAAVDLIAQIAAVEEADAAAWLSNNASKLEQLLARLAEAATPHFVFPAAAVQPATAPAAETTSTTAAPLATPPAIAINNIAASADPVRTESTISSESSLPTPAGREQQVLRVNARNFDHLLSLASESRVAAHAMQPHLQSIQRFKKHQHETFAALEQLGAAMQAEGISESMQDKLLSIQKKTAPLMQFLVGELAELDAYERRLLRISQAMLDEVLALRMRPFRDGVQGFPRMVRDLARSLGKEVQLIILGEDTLVDRDILAKIESPLNHLLRNAVDHGLEPPEQRLAVGKAAQATITLEARHSAGMLMIQVTDDGRGVDLDKVRQTIVARQMSSAPMAQAMNTAELLEFLLLPAFSIKETASQVSGRGVGLDVVQTAVRQLYGTVTLETLPGHGFHTQLRLPLSQSVVRVVVVRIAGQAYALPIAKIQRILDITEMPIHTLNDAQFFTLGGEHIGLISAAQVLGLGETLAPPGSQPVIVIGSGQRRYALAVDMIEGENSLAVQSLEAIFGKMRDISAAALLDDGSPVLILDVADLLVSIDKLTGEGHLQRLQTTGAQAGIQAKRVLVVDDSLTVREMERKLLQARGFEVDVAVDGMDGWNAVRSGNYQLVITDVDMPRMDGIELVNLIKKDSRLYKLPVMIVSYKDRPEDRARGLSAGADYYLTKGSFHDETLLNAVIDLIGTSGT